MTISTDGANQLWNDFSNYVRKPYEENPAKCVDISSWLINARRILTVHNIKLSFVQAQHELTRYAFKAYSFNDQMYFSDDPAVMTLPNMRGTSLTSGDKWVGIWLHNEPEQDTDFKLKTELSLNLLPNIFDAENNFKQFHVTEITSPWFQDLVAKHVDHLADKAFYGSDENFALAGRIDLEFQDTCVRFSDDRARYAFFHPDAELAIYYKNENIKKNGGWKRVLSYAAKGPGTEYKIGVTEAAAFICPLGATSSHISRLDVWGRKNLREGAMHRAVGSANGRAILLMESKVAPTLPEAIISPWQIKELSSCLLA